MFLEAANGEEGVRIASARDRPEAIVADEIASREGAFSLARTLRDDPDPYTGHDRDPAGAQARRVARRWSGADAWFVKPIDPFELADRVLELVTEKESA